VASLEEDGVLESHLAIDILVEDECEHTRPAGPDGVVEGGQPVPEEVLARVAVDESEVELAEDKDHVLVEVVANEQTDASVGQPSVMQSQNAEILELADGVVCRALSLSALVAAHADAYVRFH